jgi:hypothetical protein
VFFCSINIVVLIVHYFINIRYMNFRPIHMHCDLYFFPHVMDCDCSMNYKEVSLGLVRFWVWCQTVECLFKHGLLLFVEAITECVA